MAWPISWVGCDAEPAAAIDADHNRGGAPRMPASDAARVSLQGNVRKSRRRRGACAWLLAEDFDALEHDVLVRTIACRGDVGDFLHDFLAADDRAEDRMLLVEMGRRALGDEPLRTVGVRARVRHREDAG